MSPPVHSTNAITLAEYLFTRLHQLGVVSVFGVPGDYNLRLLDFVESSGLHWVGNCNELNAAYAADAYARMHGLSALVTTFGVGELSAANGIAGAYAEKAPVVHIVGTPSRNLQDQRVAMHHTFADGDYGRFAAMATHITAAQVSLRNGQLAPGQIDWILEQAFFHQRPVYLEIPDDMADTLVSKDNLGSILRTEPPSSPTTDDDGLAKVQRVIEKIYSAKRPLIFVDGESRNIHLLDEIHRFINLTNWPTWTTPFGKGLVNEDLPTVHGIYGAKYGNEEATAYFASADLALYFGPHISDTNTYGFTAIPDERISVYFSNNEIRTDGHVWRDLTTKSFVLKVLEELDPSRLAKVDGPAKFIRATAPHDDSGLLTQKNFYHVVNQIFRTGDIILAETGTAAHGGRFFKLPPASRLFTAVTWLSIGYMLPATLGAALAQRDARNSHPQGENGSSSQGRAILFIGDGSFQMTAQELSTIIKERLNVIIFIINNSGYTIERAIHGRNMGYNDISAWDHRLALEFFGLDSDASSRGFFRAKTWKELDQVLQSTHIQQGDGVKIVEVFMGREDCTGSLQDLLADQILKGTSSVVTG